ncbi:MAG: dapB [Aeromicrobium sp.]|nr:dapB [Aeromicrobium sp.]
MTTRVIVGYTGGVGSQVVRLLDSDPDTEVVGALVHSEAKDGRDVGELVGIAPLGVLATRDVDALVALRADVLLWHGMTWEPEVVARFLEVGTNVYSSIGGWWVHGQPEQDLLAAACEKGGSTLVSGGNIPGLVSDVLPLFVSGYSGMVTKIRAFQSDYVPTYPSAMQLEMGLGIGVVPDTAEGEISPVDQMWLWGIEQSARIVGAGMGIEVSDVRLSKKEYANAPHDLELSPSGLKVRAGTPAGVRWTYTAYTGDGVAFYELVNEQTVHLGLGDGWRETADEPHWRVEIDGTPSITCVLDLPHGTDGADNVSALNAARAVNFIPRLVAAAAGCSTVLDVPAPRANGHLLGGQR